jgi:hypothetical protein
LPKPQRKATEKKRKSLLLDVRTRQLCPFDATVFLDFVIGGVLSSPFITFSYNEKMSLLRPKKKMRLENNNNDNNAAKRDDISVFDYAIDEDNNNDGILLTLLDLDIPLLFHIFNYLGETQGELRNLILVSKQVYQICYGSYGRPGIEWRIIPTFEIRPLLQQHDDGGIGGGSIETLLNNLYDHSLNVETNNKFQFYRHMRVKDVHKFQKGKGEIDIPQIRRNIRMSGITLLDFSIQLSPIWVQECCFLTYTLPYIFPNLRELDLSNVSVCTTTLENFSENCHFLEKITSPNNNVGHDLSGHELRFSDNLKEIYMDNSVFFFGFAKFSDLINHPEVFIFHHCCKSLERVSIRNVKHLLHGEISQNALVKFVRNAPSSMRWFRSDLSQDNITMLRLERPEIELVN